MHQGKLCEAIKEKRQIALRYDDDRADRTFAPHIVFRSTKGNMCVGGIQINNPEKPKERNEWRNLSLDQIKSIRLLDETFKTSADFDPRDERYGTRIACQVKQDV